MTSLLMNKESDMQTHLSFGSDNHSGVHPAVMLALAEANQGHTPAYGADPWTAKAKHLLKQCFGADSEIFFVFNGTAANTLAIRSLCQPYEAVFAASNAHIQEDECGAPEYICGNKILTVASEEGKLSLKALEQLQIDPGNPHRVLPRLVSITQATESGTVYTLSQLQDICDLAHKKGMLVHMDGARLANAAAFLGLELADCTSAVGIDALSFGGTKNGLLCAEALIFLKPGLAHRFDYLQKQSMQLASKMRFLSSQFIPYLEQKLWLTNAQNANSMAQYLRSRLSKLSSVHFPYPTQANEVFVRVNPTQAQHLYAEAAAYPWDEGLVRLVCSFDTTKEAIDRLFTGPLTI